MPKTRAKELNDRQLFAKAVINQAEHFTANVFIPRQTGAGLSVFDKRHDFATIEDACSWGLARFNELTERGIRARSILVYAVRGAHSALVRTYVPPRGWEDAAL